MCLRQSRTGLFISEARGGAETLAGTKECQQHGGIHTREAAEEAAAEINSAFLSEGLKFL